MPPASAADTRPDAGPVLRADAVVLRLADPERRYQRVRLYQELSRPRDGIAALHTDGVWTALLPRPDLERDGATRVEYAWIVTHPDGGEEFRTDPGNPLVAEGAFGAKSVLELPGYEVPRWVEGPDPGQRGSIDPVELPSRRLRGHVHGLVWRPPGVEPLTALPLLVVHDGPEYAELAGLVRLLDLAYATGRIPALRAALLAPMGGRRDETYGASAGYTGALISDLLPALAPHAPQPADQRPVLMGASLGALAALHLAVRHPHAVSGLFLQSGSYFRQRTDRQERGFARFDRIARFVGQVLRAAPATVPLPITLTCGTAEENLGNNRAMAEALERAGHAVVLATGRDGHGYTAWRDLLDPHLPDLLVRAFATPVQG